MSRRARRRGRSGGRGHWWLRGGVAVLVLAVVGMGGGYVWLRSWLHSEDFRQMLAAEVGKSLGAEADFGEFRWDGTNVDCRSFTASGGEVVGAIDAQGISMGIGLGRIGERVVELRNARIHQIEAFFDLRGGASPPAPAPPPLPGPTLPAAKPAWYERWVPNDFQLTGLEIGHSSVRLGLDDGEIVFRDTSWAVSPGQRRGSYEMTGSGGRLTFPWTIVPELRLGEARMRYQDEVLFLLDSDFRLYERGYARLTGEASDGGFGFDGSLADVRAHEVLPEDWRQRIEGRVEADFSVVDVASGAAVSGELRLLDGVLTALPVLDALGAYGGSPRFRRLALSEATTDFRWEDGVVTLTNLRLGSEGLIRVEGRLRVEADERIDGRFRVGLTPGTLARIPGAETSVFLPGERGLLWTDLRLSGTLDEPREDLTERLIAAAGMRMFEVLPETGEQVLKFTERVIDPETIGQLTGDDGLVGKGRDFLDTGKSLIEGGGGLLEEADKTLRKGRDLVRGVEGIFGFFEEKEEPPSDPSERAADPARQPQ